MRDGVRTCDARSHARLMADPYIGQWLNTRVSGQIHGVVEGISSQIKGIFDHWSKLICVVHRWAIILNIWLKELPVKVFLAIIERYVTTCKNVPICIFLPFLSFLY